MLGGVPGTLLRDVRGDAGRDARRMPGLRRTRGRGASAGIAPAQVRPLPRAGAAICQSASALPSRRSARGGHLEAQVRRLRRSGAAARIALRRVRGAAIATDRARTAPSFAPSRTRVRPGCAPGASRGATVRSSLQRPSRTDASDRGAGGTRPQAPRGERAGRLPRPARDSGRPRLSRRRRPDDGRNRRGSRARAPRGGRCARRGPHARPRPLGVTNPP